MRMFNPEWEAIRHSDLQSNRVDLVFDLDGRTLPADHGYALYLALVACVPALKTIGLALHTISGAASGRGDGNLVLNRRAKLILRVPTTAVTLASALCEQQIDLGTGAIRIGAVHARPLLPYADLHTPLLCLDLADEIAFMAEARTQLNAIGVIAGGLICNKPRIMLTPNGSVHGFGLMIYGLPPEQSLLLQELGLGWGREYGCGVFVPHKSIKEVARD